jgi:hypothetical protein
VVHAGLIGAKAGGAERTGGQRRSHWCTAYSSWAPRAATNREEQRPMPLTNSTRRAPKRLKTRSNHVPKICIGNLVVNQAIRGAGAPQPPLRSATVFTHVLAPICPKKSAPNRCQIQ